MGKRGDGEGTITHNKTRGRWEGRMPVGHTPDGRLIRRKVTGATRAEVVTKLRELRLATDSGRSPARSDLTVARFLDEWVTEVVPGSVAPATAVQYRDVVRLYIKPHLGRKHLTKLTALDVAHMLRELEVAGRAANTRRLARSVLRRALRWAEGEGLVMRNVAAIANGIRLNSPEGRTLTPEQARHLLSSVAGHRLETAFTVALALGLRRGELLGLAWDDIDLDGTPPRLTVRRGLQRISGIGMRIEDTKTRGSRRTVHLPAFVAASLRSHRARQAADRLRGGPQWQERPFGLDFVFRTPLGTPIDPDNFRNLTYKVTEAAGLGRWSPHELRHSAASLLIAMGVDLKVISETLGHSSIRITADVYGHLMEPARAEAAAAMDAAFGGARP